MLGLLIALLLINLAGAMACCVGLFVSVGVSYGAMAIAYLDLTTVRRPAPEPPAFGAT